MRFGYAAVRRVDEPLDVYTFNLWWLDLQRYNLVQTKEGREQIRMGVQVRGLNAYERHPEDDPSVPKVATPDGARLDEDTFTNPRKLLSMLPKDDPRAAFVRQGGRLDKDGNPLKADGTPYQGVGRLPTWYLAVQEELRQQSGQQPSSPPPQQSTATTTTTPPPPSAAPAMTTQEALRELGVSSSSSLSDVAREAGLPSWPAMPDLPNLR